MFVAVDTLVWIRKFYPRLWQIHLECGFDIGLDIMYIYIYITFQKDSLFTAIDRGGGGGQMAVSDSHNTDFQQDIDGLVQDCSISTQVS